MSGSFSARFPTADGDDVAGVFDWDLAGPTTPLMELGFIAWNCVPPWRDLGDAQSGAERRLDGDLKRPIR
jgi:aminoglycoside phosphotransferase (APT) family kinase protein